MNFLLATLLLVAGSDGETAEQPGMRAWSDSSGKFHAEAGLAAFEDGRVRLQTRDGKTISLAIGQLSKTDQEYVRGPDSETLSALDGSRLMKVVATGVGVDPDNALLNALSHAIEQAVGVMVDAESIIENDQLVHDRILTCTRGDVEYYQVMRRWREDGLQCARVWALVSPTKLGDKLTSQNLSVRKVPAELRELWARQKADDDAVKDAPEMFQKIMEGFQVEKLVVVQVVEDLEVLDKDETFAKVRMKVRLAPDMKRWEQLLGELRPFLERIAEKRAKYRYRGTTLLAPSYEELGRRLAGRGVLISVSTGIPRGGDVFEWEAFRVPGSLEDVLKQAMAQRFRLVFALLDEANNVVFRTEQELDELGGMPSGSPCLSFVTYGSMSRGPGFSASNTGAYWLSAAPYSLRGRTPYWECDKVVNVELELLRKVHTSAAFLEPAEPDASIPREYPGMRGMGPPRMPGEPPVEMRGMGPPGMPGEKRE
ncbi:MAG TPA: SHD1 domain-containing protein [Thermoguttaceae bacterium]|nr:SHD1 domain-containing protein [Thermoguttaceae bacterium]